jgi:hypothetical protein
MITDQNTPAQKLEKIRSDFPALSVKVNGKPLVYFDSGATAQKPRPVIEAKCPGCYHATPECRTTRRNNFYRRNNGSHKHGCFLHRQNEF